MLYPFVDETMTPLPRALSTTDKSVYANVKSSFCCEYNEQKTIGISRNEKVGAVRALHPIPTECRIYYFEILIRNQGEKGLIGIGLTSDGSKINRMPGWEEHTIGYLGSDGKLYSGSQSGFSFGPHFTTNDVIGCGILLNTNTVFFTKNGYLLGSTSPNLSSKPWYPTVGLHSKNESIEVNFGQNSFVYDISECTDEILSLEQTSNFSKYV